MMDDNAKVGKVACGGTVKNFDLVIRNNRRDRLIQECKEENQILPYASYKLPSRRLST